MIWPMIEDLIGNWAPLGGILFVLGLFALTHLAFAIVRGIYRYLLNAKTFEVRELSPIENEQHAWMIYADARPLYRTLTYERSEAMETALNLATCSKCRARFMKGKHVPKHRPAPLCKVGGKVTHCTCKACWH